MKRVFFLAAFMLLSTAMPAEAQMTSFRHRRAPEPLTLLGLGVGASALGAARWYSNRKKRK